MLLLRDKYRRAVALLLQRSSCSTVILLIFIMLTAGCGHHPHEVKRSIYYWKTNFSTKGYTGKRLKEVQCNNIYLHCFDVDWNAIANKPEPVAVVRFPDEAPDRSFAYTPVVFITQPVLKKIRREDLPVLAANIARLLQQLTGNRNIPVKEIQIDCDWTAATKDVYFTLLEQLKQQDYFKGKLLSCTIRLHQVKYKTRSGIPPVDRGLLMCYNLGDLKKAGDHNSILNAGLAKDYLQDMDSYPLTLDIALPLFSWCIQFRGPVMKGILRDVSDASIKNVSCFKRRTDHLYTCTADTIWQGYDFRRGDEVRIEAPSMEDIRSVAAFTARKLKNDSLSVILFHADSLTLAKYSNNDLEAIYNAYH